MSEGVWLVWKYKKPFGNEGLRIPKHRIFRWNHPKIKIEKHMENIPAKTETLQISMHCVILLKGLWLPRGSRFTIHAAQGTEELGLQHRLLLWPLALYLRDVINDPTGPEVCPISDPTTTMPVHGCNKLRNPQYKRTEWDWDPSGIPVGLGSKVYSSSQPGDDQKSKIFKNDHPRLRETKSDPAKTIQNSPKIFLRSHVHMIRTTSNILQPVPCNVHV